MEHGTRTDGPAARLLRLWLWVAPLGMLALAVLFGVLAAVKGNWGLLAAMILLALAALGLWLAQRRLLKRIENLHDRS